MKSYPELPFPEFMLKLLLVWTKKQSISLRLVLQTTLLFAVSCLGAAAQTQLPPTLTPAPSSSPRITGPQLYGAFPDTPFTFLITATGDAITNFSVSGLPSGLSVNSTNGLITGSVSQRGAYDTTVTVQNDAGTASRPLRIVIGDQIGLTPAMGYNPFNSYGTTFTDQIIRANAAAIVSSKLINFGYQYVNLDEGWEGPRSTSAPYGPFNPGPLTANSKFPNFPGLISYVHSLNLKFGVYSTPLPVGYSGFTGGTYVTPDTDADQNGENLLASPQDVQQFVDWGVDYLKYDGNDEGDVDVQTTSATVRSATRDIVYSLSQSTGALFTEASTVSKIGNSWRTAFDMNDQWVSVLQDFGPVTYSDGTVKPSPSDWAPYTGPGRFGDLDMLVEGYVAFGGGALHLSNLLPDEQYSHFSILSLIASPLLMGCDLTQLDQFTQGLFANADVLDVDQDALGLQATLKTSTNGTSGYQVWSRPLADGSVAVGLFNLSGASGTVTVNWSDIGVNGNQLVHDLWRQQDLGNYNGSFSATVNSHGVVLVKITPTASNRPRITQQPVNAYVQEGQSATFSVTASGSNLTYQWTKNGSPISGANGSTYTTPATAYSDNGSYFRVIVNDSNNTGQVYSYETRLKVYGASTTDLALNQPATASGSNFTVSYPASNAVDGNVNDGWWGLHIDPSWLYVDLGANYNINEIKILTDVSSSFTVDVAPEGSNNLSAEDPNAASPWTTVGSASGITTFGNISDFTGLSGFGRYVRFQSLSRYTDTTYDLPTVHELYVYGNYTNGQPGGGGPTQPINTSTGLSISPNTSTLTEGESYTLTATVSPASGSTTPSGNVVFTIGSATQSVSLSNGVATYNGAAPSSTGTLSLSAQYQGNSSFNSSNSSTLSETITSGGGPGGTTQTQVNLSSAGANTIGFTNDNSSFSGGGIDGDGNAYSTNQTGSSLTFQGITYNFSAPDQKDVFAGGGNVSIALPSGNYSTLYFLGLAVDGSQTGSFNVNYTSGSPTTLSNQQLSDWFNSQGYSGEAIAATYQYRDNNQGAQSGGPLHLYAYSITLDSSRTATSLTLPNNQDIVVAAVTLVGSGSGGSSPSQVSLSGVANTIGLTNDNSGFSGGGVDNDGNAYSANQTGSSLTDSQGALFNFGTPGVKDVVNGSNAPVIPLTSGKYSTLKLLGLAVNGSQSGTFLVTYSDNSTDQLPLTLSDWFNSQNYNHETVAATYPYRDNNQGAQSGGPLNLYEYTLGINNGKTVKSLTLPNNQNIVVVAATLLP